jgi:hypothetical protein
MSDECPKSLAEPAGAFQFASDTTLAHQCDARLLAS